MDFSNIEMLFIWLILSVFFLIFEIGHPGLFFFLSFSFGSFFTALTTLFLTSTQQQLYCFTITTLITFFILKKYSKNLQKEKPFTSNNISALLGKEALVIKQITPHTFGQVKIGREQWAARSLYNKQIKENNIVKVLFVHGAHVVVEKVKTNN